MNDDYCSVFSMSLTWNRTVMYVD